MQEIDFEIVTVEELKEEIKNGDNIHAKDKDGWTPLMHASDNNKNPKVIERLLKHGAK